MYCFIFIKLKFYVNFQKNETQKKIFHNILSDCHNCIKKIFVRNWPNGIYSHCVKIIVNCSNHVHPNVWLICTSFCFCLWKENKKTEKDGKKERSQGRINSWKYKTTTGAVSRSCKIGCNPSITDGVHRNENFVEIIQVFSTFSNFFKKEKKIIKAILCNFSMRLLKYFYKNFENFFCPPKHEKTTLKSCS